ncbi:MAG: hypothetical protein KAH20_03105 [Methylococcales bacterium]|nr:hypothetical protein [Methylococcales bacterium]
MLSNSAKLSAYNLAHAGFLFFLYFITTSNLALADWNSGVTIEDVSTRIAIDVVDDGVYVTINMASSAIAQLQNNTSDTVDSFALSAIKIQTATQQLSPSIKKPKEISDQRQPAASKSSSVINIFFPFSSDTPPQKLEINPDFKLINQAGEQYIITVSHQGLPIIDHGVLTNAETLSLNWQDPWYSHFLNPKLKRDHNDPVMAFLYLEPRQIKSEIVVRIKEMANWTELGLRDEVMIFPDEFASLKQKVSQFLLAKNQVSAENTKLTPTLDRVDYIRMGAADIQAYEPQQAQRQVATLIGVSITYQTKALPATVKWQWNLFNEKIKRVAIRAYDPAGLFDSYVTPNYPIFEWENMLADIDLPELSDTQKTTLVPVEQNNNFFQYFWLFGIIGFLVLSLFSCKFINPRLKPYGQLIAVILTFTASYTLIKSGKLNLSTNGTSLDKEKAKPVMKQLLWNVYQAFESTQEEAAYDQLADSVSGELRETLYLQNRQSFLAQDGAWSKVKNIEIKNLTESISSLDDSHLFDCEWLVVGEVIHWGHQHRRENLYRANIKISPQDGNWKIFQLESIGQERVDDTKS